MLKDNEEKLTEITEVCKIHLKRLNSGYNNIREIFPISIERYNALTDVQIAYVDQYIFRFAKLQDTIGEKLFKQIFIVFNEQIENFTFRDILNKIPYQLRAV